MQRQEHALMPAGRPGWIVWKLSKNNIFYGGLP
jgi:hypothetical protein